MAVPSLRLEQSLTGAAVRGCWSRGVLPGAGNSFVVR